MDEARWDVIVVGSGPGGCMAAKRCVQGGLKTLLLEKRRLPREKVCSGLIMGPWAKDIIQQEFGEMPREILTEPAYFKGIMLHIPGAESKRIPNSMPVGWRRDLDYWMCQKALEAGAEVRDRVKVTDVAPSEAGYEVRIQKGAEEITFYARFVIGADGAASATRKFVSPDLPVKCRPAFRHCFEGELRIEKDYFHWFYPMASSSPRFDLIHKGGLFLIEGGGLKKLGSTIKRILKDYGLDPDSRPIWRDGCLVSAPHGDLLKGRLRPARDNVLLVGDAAGFILPVTFEGIGTALKSGLLAAEAVLEALRQGKKAETIYSGEVRGILEFIGHLRSLAQGTREAEREGAVVFAESLSESMAETMRAPGR
jgi:flavin-dependent dehydrogenase